MNQEFIHLRNYHSATALGEGLWNAGFRLTEPWLTWPIISPEDNFAGYRARVLETPGLLFLFPHVTKLVQSGNAPDQLYEIFRFVQYFGNNQTAAYPRGDKEVGRLSELFSQINRVFSMYNCCISR